MTCHTSFKSVCMYAVACARGPLLTSMEAKKFHEGKHFCLELMKDFPHVCVDETSIEFSSDRAFSIDPGKTASFYIHQKGDHLVHFEPTRYYTSLMMVPPHSSMKTMGPHFTLVNHSDYPASISSHKKIFKATFMPIDDVDIYLPHGNGLKDLEEREKDIHSLNYVEYKEAKEQAERNRISHKVGKAIADSLKRVTDKQTQVD